MKARTRSVRDGEVEDAQGEDAEGEDDPSLIGSWARPGRARPVRQAGGRPTSTETPGGRSNEATSGERRGRGRIRASVVPEEQDPVWSGPAPRNRAGAVGLAFGLLSLVFMALIPPLGLLFSLLATGFGLVARGRVRRGEASNRGQAMIGLVCGLIGLIVSGALVVTEAIYVANHPSLLHSLSQCDVLARTAKARSACAQRLTKAVEGP